MEILLAHTAESGSGPELELLIAALGVLILGVVFFLQKAVKPVVSIVLVLVAVVLAFASFQFGDDEEEGAPAPEVALAFVSPADGDVVPAGEGFDVEISIDGGTIATDETTEQEGAGHLHIFVDGTLAQMPTGETTKIEIDEPGAHTLAVEFVSPDHHPFDPPITTEIEITAE